MHITKPFSRLVLWFPSMELEVAPLRILWLSGGLEQPLALELGYHIFLTMFCGNYGQPRLKFGLSNQALGRNLILSK